jgi:hypothetical protein
VSKPGDPNPRRTYSEHLYEDARCRIPSLKFKSDHILGRALQKRGCRSFHDDKRGWEFPPLKEAREAWQKKAPNQKWEHDFDDWLERMEEEPRKW